VSDYSNPAVDALLAKAEAAPPGAVRTDSLQQVLTMVNRDLPFWITWWDNSIVAINSAYVLRDRGPFQEFDTPWITSIRRRP
jgi:ABC-type transport system substrate-binding protein